MDPLQPLFELYDEMRVQPKPNLKDVEPPVETPRLDQAKHPVTIERDEIDNHRKSGASAEDAHQAVLGAVSTADTQSKAKLAATLGRVQGEKDRKGVVIDKDGESLLAKDEKMDSIDPVTKDDLRTPKADEVPTRDVIDTQEEYDYNEDVMYLRKYGRA